jgi:hypothetical protein
MQQQFGLVPTMDSPSCNNIGVKCALVRRYARFETKHEVLTWLIGAVLAMQYSHNLGAGAALPKLLIGMAFWGDIRGFEMEGHRRP